MTKKSANNCPHCGEQIQIESGAPIQVHSGAPPTPTRPHVEEAADSMREYDHRGILMPQRTRVGGIITPQ